MSWEQMVNGQDNMGTLCSVKVSGFGFQTKSLVSQEALCDHDISSSDPQTTYKHEAINDLSLTIMR